MLRVLEIQRTHLGAADASLTIGRQFIRLAKVIANTDPIHTIMYLSSSPAYMSYNIVV